MRAGNGSIRTTTPRHAASLANQGGVVRASFPVKRISDAEALKNYERFLAERAARKAFHKRVL